MIYLGKVVECGETRRVCTKSMLMHRQESPFRNGERSYLRINNLVPGSTLKVQWRGDRQIALWILSNHFAYCVVIGFAFVGFCH